MCIAIMKPEGKVIPEDTLLECWNNNPDGAGFMYAEDGKLHIHKGFMGWSGFWKAWKKHQDKKSVIHFRIRTHGKTDAENTHPFQVGDNLAFVHNGTIGNVSIDNKDFSDTYHFNTKLMKKLYKADSRFIFKEHFQELVSAYIGWSKLIFLDAKGNHVIVNEDKGKWDEDIWYSNTSYQARAVSKITPYVPQTFVPKSQGYLSIGSRVKLKGHPSLEGTGFISYFGNGSSVGVKLDDREQITLVHGSFVYPEPTTKSDKYEFKEGDFVCRVGSTILGEIVEFKGKSALVEFFNHQTNQISTLMVGLNNLEPWESTQCGI